MWYIDAAEIATRLYIPHKQVSLQFNVEARGCDISYGIPASAATHQDRYQSRNPSRHYCSVITVNIANIRVTEAHCRCDVSDAGDSPV